MSDVSLSNNGSCDRIHLDANLVRVYFDIPAGSIENAHRVGQSSGGKPRQIIARFYSRVTRRLVMTSAREALAGTGFRLVDDLTPKDLEAKRRVLPYMEKKSIVVHRIAVYIRKNVKHTHLKI